jgi:hypothetical protein
MTQPPDTPPPPAGEPDAARPPGPASAQVPTPGLEPQPQLQAHWATPAVPVVPPPTAPLPASGYTPTHARYRQRGALIAVAALTVALLLCAGGGVGAYLWLRDTDGQGAADPVAAVEDFLQTVYVDKDPARAAALVCAEARDEPALAEKIREIDAYTGTLARPLFRWQVDLVDETEQVAAVAVTITMTTRDEKVASQRLSVTVLHKTGWWVCDVEAEDPSAPADPTPAGPTPDPGESG